MKIHPVVAELFPTDTHIHIFTDKILESAISLIPIILKMIKNIPYVRQKKKHILLIAFPYYSLVGSCSVHLAFRFL
jgi:hypothetical protein